jgi:hypothetical protein
MTKNFKDFILQSMETDLDYIEDENQGFILKKLALDNSTEENAVAVDNSKDRVYALKLGEDSYLDYSLELDDRGVPEKVGFSIISKF